jgi:cyclopropane fatty-acyl-phospholipid synthase-like methyltransferase
LAFAAIARHGASVAAFDATEEMLDKARARCAKAGLRNVEAATALISARPTRPRRAKAASQRVDSMSAVAARTQLGGRDLRYLLPNQQSK